MEGEPDPRTYAIIEVTGERKQEKEAKAATARTLWVPAVNNHGGFGRWAFLEITDPYDDVAETLRRFVAGSRSEISVLGAGVSEMRDGEMKEKGGEGMMRG